MNFATARESQFVYPEQTGVKRSAEGSPGRKSASVWPRAVVFAVLGLVVAEAGGNIQSDSAPATRTTFIDLAPSREVGFVRACYVPDFRWPRHELVIFTDLYPPGTWLEFTPEIEAGPRPSLQVLVAGSWRGPLLPERFVLASEDSASRPVIPLTIVFLAVITQVQEP